LREIEGLREACQSLGIKKGTILSFDEEGEREKENISIEIIPVWKWLLE
jgi:predicted AAA+ superfamily ATPase